MTTTRCLLLLALLLALEAPAAAQTVRADRVTLNAGPCVITSGPTAPNGSRIGNVCDTFIQTTSGAIWTKTSGTGTSSGWIATLAGTGTPGTLPVWTSAGAIGDSIIAQAGGVATITGSATITGTGTMSTEHVTGNSTIDAALAVGGTSTLTGSAILRSILDVTGVTTLRSDTSITGNTVLGGWIGSVSYASQVSGWRLTNAGAADVRYLFTDELRAKLFTADKESVLAGSMRVTKSYSTVYAFTCPAAGTATDLYVYDAPTYPGAAVFQDGDWVVIHTLTRTAFGPFTIADCVGQVNTYSAWTTGTQHWAFTRSSTGGGSMTGGTVVAQNELVQDFGSSGNGYVEISALDGPNGVNAPYIQTNTWTTSPVAGNIVTRCRLGNLNGLLGIANEFGMFCGTPFSATAPFIRLSNTAFQIRNLPIDLWNNNAQVVSLDPAGPSLAMGNPIPTAFGGTTAGFWMGRDSADGLYKVRIGNPTGNRLTYANGTLSIAGEGSGITNINGGNITAGTITAAQLNITAHPGGAALNPDPMTSDPSQWVTSGNPAFTAAVITTISDGVVGLTSLRSALGKQGAMSQPSSSLDAHKTYRIHAWARSGGGATSPLSIRFNAFSGTGAYLGEIGVGIDNVPVPTTWTEYIGAMSPANFPANTVTGSVEIYFNYPSPGAGYTEVQDVRIEEMAPSTLIKDGVITTTKIQAGAITSAQIAANTITVGNLNASGFGDNLIKNSTMEGPVGHAIDGWALDPSTGAGGAIGASCCGTRGPGTLLITPPPSGFTIASYYAVPVQGGTTYRVALDFWSGVTTSGGLYIRFMESSSTTAPPPRYVGTGTTGLFLGNDSYTDLAANAGLHPSWNHFEFTYTPPAATQWVSLTFWDANAAANHVDAVEMQPQLGAGHIRAGSITAGQIASNTITSANIAVRTLIAGNIAGGTITTTEIAAGTITAANIAARTITSGYIATGTITANELAATSITADKLNVSSLSAISANLGTVTAGTINGVTINGTTINGSTMHAGGGNEVTIDSGGLTLASGTGNANQIKWSSGGSIYGSSTTLTLRGGDIQIGANNGSTTYFFESNAFQGAAGLGTQSIPWTSLFLTPPTNNNGAGGSSFYPLQLNSTDNQVHQKRNGYDGQCVITAGKSLYIDHGIVIGCV